jgi:hypothetical protein
MLSARNIIMSSKSKFTVEEYDGNRYPDIKTAQAVAVKLFAIHLTDTFRDLLKSGKLVIANGQIMVYPRKGFR